MAEPVGRPTKYKEEYAYQAEKLCRLGATDKEMADFFNVSKSTLNLWKLEHEDFSDSIKKGKIIADANVADSLYKRAIGYEHEEDKIFLSEGQPIIVPTIKHYPPDSTACFFWLKNRKPEVWRDKQDVNLSGNVGIEVVWQE